MCSAQWRKGINISRCIVVRSSTKVMVSRISRKSPARHFNLNLQSAGSPSLRSSLPQSMPTTISSLNDPHVHLDPSTPPTYLHHVIASTLKRKGFEGAEVGARWSKWSDWSSGVSDVLWAMILCYLPLSPQSALPYQLGQLGLYNGPSPHSHLIFIDVQAWSNVLMFARWFA